MRPDNGIGRIAPALLALGVLQGVTSAGDRTSIVEPDAGVHAEFATRIRARGAVQVSVEDDFQARTSRTIYTLEDASSGLLHRLQFLEPPTIPLRTGDRIAVNGTLVGGILRVGQRTEDFRLLASAQAAVVGARSSVVLVLDFSDSDVSCSVGQVRGLMFDGSLSVDGLYKDSSFDQLSFPGDTDNNGSSDVFRLSVSPSIQDACDANAWAQAGDQAAVAAGINLSLYQHRVYVLPTQVDCEWAGKATVGCFGFCRAWVRTCNLPDVYAHELGHNLGLYHASTDPTNAGVVDCEYCDQSDFMGIGGVGWRQNNAPHKAELGWVPEGQIEDYAGGARTVVISALETDPSVANFPQIIRIPRSGGGSYYLSYRQPVGYDLTLGSLYRSRLSIHSYAGNGSNTLFLRALGSGDEFQDQASELTITYVSQTSSTLTALIATAGAGPVDDLSAREIHNWFLNLEWSEVLGATGYRVYRDGELVGFRRDALYTDWAVVPGVTYVYHVTAVFGESESAPGNTIQAGVVDHGQQPRIPRVRYSGSPP